MVMKMEENLYQGIAEEVRAEIQRNLRQHPLVINPVTLKGGCQNAAKMVYDKLTSYGETPSIFKLRHRYGDGVWEQGIHIVVAYNGLVIDPVITQFFPDMQKYVFPEDAYPLNIVEKTDVTNSQFLCDSPERIRTAVPRVPR